MPFKTKWVIMADKYGQIGNRLFLFGHMIAHAIENKYGILNPYFDEYREYFESHQTNQPESLRIKTRLLRFPLLNRLLMSGFSKLTGLCYRLFPVTGVYRILRIYEQEKEGHYNFFNMESAGFESLLDKPYLITQGFGFRSKQNVIRHKDEIRNLFHLTSVYRDHVSRLVSKYRAGVDCLVGIHIRRGDYFRHADGAYFYDYEVYRRLMDETQKLLAGKKVRFLLCSNEPIPEASFAGLSTISAGGHFIEDMYCLAACDYIIGPPSTYSQWASFYGSVPLMIVWDRNQSVSMEAFLISAL